MATKADKKNAIRQDIIDSAGIYSQNLAAETDIRCSDIYNDSQYRFDE